MLIMETPEWAGPTEHHRSIAGRHLRDLFAEDSRRGATLACSADDLYLDYSKNRLTAETVRLLAALAERDGGQPAPDRPCDLFLVEQAKV
jgi:glucose-6-phosphate isomerase